MDEKKIESIIFLQRYKLAEVAFTINMILETSNKGIPLLNKEDKCRLKFLLQTLESTNLFLEEIESNGDYFSTFLTIDCSIIEIFFSIKSLIIENILETLKFVQMGGNLTNNFDILELKLRSNFDETKAIFLSENSLIRVENHIKDEQAKKDWVEHFGMNCYVVEFNNFIEFLEKKNILDRESENYEKKINYFRYFLNFPSKDVVTPYKWGLLIHLFEPYNKFNENFFKLMNENGFLGLINRIEAFEILESSPNKSLLIRMSRTEPQLLAVSYKTSKGIIEHQVNRCSKTKEIIPIYEFIEKKFKDYKLVPFNLCTELIFNNFEDFSLSDYALSDDGFFKKN